MTNRQKEIVLTLADCNMSTSNVAKKLYMHRNTILYHIEKIQEQTGLNPLKFYDLCKLLEMVKEGE